MYCSYPFYVFNSLFLHWWYFLGRRGDVRATLWNNNKSSSLLNQAHDSRLTYAFLPGAVVTSVALAQEWSSCIGARSMFVAIMGTEATLVYVYKEKSSSGFKLLSKLIDTHFTLFFFLYLSSWLHHQCIRRCMCNKMIRLYWYRSHQHGSCVHHPCIHWYLI